MRLNAGRSIPTYGHIQSITLYPIACSSSIIAFGSGKRDGSKRQSPYPACQVSSIIITPGGTPRESIDLA